ncbi:MAG: PEP-CTERM sorting domain-containing protein [Akkermansiaceae bacterium]|nr:PEP-CTERM sorting domain-containing protein [Akkermansiaceae bacterium]
MKTSFKKTCVLMAAASLLGFIDRTDAAVVTYNFGGTFVSSKWNADSSNVTRTPGGPVSGSFSIDTDTMMVSALFVTTEFYSLYGTNQQVMGATYNYGVTAMADDLLGTKPASTYNISGMPSLPVYIGLTTDLTGGTDVDGAGPRGNGSMIMIMDSVPSGTFGVRAFRPYLTLLMEGVDFSSYIPSTLSLDVYEHVYNVNIGNGVAGYSGAQNLTTLTATVVPEPSAIWLLGLGGLVAAFKRSRR